MTEQMDQEEMKRLYPQLSEPQKGFVSGRNPAIKTWWFPLELTNGNAGRGFHWGSKAKERKKLEAFFLSYVGGKQKPFGYPVELTVTRVLGRGQRFWDSDSILRGNWKEIQDSLVAVGLFVDDSPKWITKVTGRQDDTSRDTGPSIEITVIRSGL